MAEREPVRTDVYCHSCDGNFICTIDYRLDGNHVVHCPYCGHEHCRVIVKGVMTSDRWDSRYQEVRIRPADVWKHAKQPIQTSTVSHFLRERWLNRGG
jgi:hypothetical protein